jgi:hypothetical protein
VIEQIEPRTRDLSENVHVQFRGCDGGATGIRYIDDLSRSRLPAQDAEPYCAREHHESEHDGGPHTEP